MNSPLRRAELTLASSILAVLAGSAAAQTQILETHSSTLTTYLGGATNLQGVLPLASQRGVNLDGSGRSGPFFNLSIAGNPFGGGAGGASRIGHVDLATGSVVIADVDWAGVGPGASQWVIGRTYNQLQASRNDGFQGLGWMQGSFPEIKHYEGASDTDDVLYIVYGADRYIELDRGESGTADYFKAKNGAAGAAKLVTGSPDIYVYYDQHGTAMYFFGGDAATYAQWQLWKVVDAAGNVSYVGDASTAATADDSYTSSTITAYDATPSNGRKYVYSLSGSPRRLDNVKVYAKTGGTWASSPTGVTEVARVMYTYYSTTVTDKGVAGDLQTVTVRTTLSDSGDDLDDGIYAETKRYYRYYTGSWNDADGQRGNPGDIKMIVDGEGTRRYDIVDGVLFDADQDGNLDTDEDSFLSATDSALLSYSSAYLEYPSSDHRVSKAVFNGDCGCSGGGAGTYEFTYTARSGFSDGSGYDTETISSETVGEWASRTVVKRPDATYMTQYFDEAGQTLSSVVTNTDPSGGPTQTWATEVVRNASGQVVHINSPANITAYVHTNGSVAFTRSTSTGLVTYFERTSSGDMTGFHETTFVTNHAGSYGPGGSTVPTYTGYTSYTSSDYQVVSGLKVIRPLVANTRAYHTGGSSAGTSANYDQTARSYAVWGGSNADAHNLAIKKITTTLPAVTTGNNGKNQTVLVERYLRQDGTTAFAREPYHADESTKTMPAYTAIDAYGRPTLSIADKKSESNWTAAGYASGDSPSNWSGLTLEGGGKDVKAAQGRTYDAQSRPLDATVQDVAGTHVSTMYYSRLEDGRLVTIAIPKVTTGPTTYHGPCSYSVTNHAGRAEFSGTIVLSAGTSTTALTSWIEESGAADGDPIAALDVGTLFRVSTSVYSDSGAQLNESRMYHTIPGSGAGSEGTNYDATRYAYDSMGRQRRAKSPDGTITLATFDTLGRSATSQVGTNDADESGTDNMVTVAESQYDSGSAGGNSHLTRQRVHLDVSGSNYRDTTYAYDYRGRMLLTTNAAAPHTLVKYDNLNRAVAVAQYTSAPASTQNPTSYATNRSALSQTFYDEHGRVWMTQRHNIDQSDGSDDADIASYTWYDDEGRVIKTKGEGGITKTTYDRLGRVTNRFVIADDGNETSYANISALSSDYVMEEHQTYYQDTTSLALMQVTISRYHSDTSTTTALDTDTDLTKLDWTGTKIKGRASITIMYYDWMGRPTDTVAVGTNAAADFDRDDYSTIPTRSDTALRTTTTYNDNGTVLQVEDPKALNTRWAYDDAGRRVAEIRNYVNGTPSGPTGADDVFTRFTFDDGHITEMWVDLDGDGTKDTDDQVTTYTYGVTKGTAAPDSKIAHNGLLKSAAYPDTSGGSDVVTYAYNAQGEVFWTKDQTGTEITTDYDVLGRVTHRRVTALDSDQDGAVLRISTVYLSRGMTDTVTQYDNATAGSGTPTDQVQWTYDGWGNLTKFEQDVDGVIGAGGRPAFSIQHAWTKRTPTNGATVLARTSTTLPGTGGWDVINYDYGSSGSLADDLSRVDSLKESSTARATYQYLGMGQVVKSHLNQPDVGMISYDSGGTPTDYAYLDRFGRVLRSVWTGDSIHDVTLTYDRNSNILTQDDANFTRSDYKGYFDALYTMDDLNRLTNTREGHMITGAISASTPNNRSREELWTDLSQTGNWERRKLDLNGDGDFTDTDELDDTGTFNKANEWGTRDTDTNASVNFTLAHNERGDMIDDGQTFEYAYDAFGRLVEGRNTSSHAAITKYRYNGLGYRIMMQYDVDADTSLENDERRYICYDERWRVIATFKNASTYPKERYVHHAAGGRGLGGSSYIDSVVMRERDTTFPWTGSDASDSSLDERLYYAQNWRADIVAIFGTDADVKEWVKYSSYGVPHSIPKGDYDIDGDVDAADTVALEEMVGGAGGWAADFNHDFALDGNDVGEHETYATGYSPTVGGYGGRGVQSRSGVDNMLGYAGYVWDGIVSANHVRHRVYVPSLGRWTRRDPIGYVDGLSLVAYATISPLIIKDPFGLASLSCGSSCSDGLSFRVAMAAPTCSLKQDDNLIRVSASRFSMTHESSMAAMRSTAWDGCNDSLFCFRMYNSTIQQEQSNMRQCMLDHGMSFTIDMVKCIVGCAAIRLCSEPYIGKGPAKLAWEVCIGACTAGLTLIDLRAIRQCLDGFNAAKESAQVVYCSCLMKRKKCPSRDQHGEDAYPGIDCNALRPGMFPPGLGL